MRISDWSSDVCSSDLGGLFLRGREHAGDQSQRVHRLRRLRARMSGGSHLARYRERAGEVAGAQHHLFRRMAEHYSQEIGRASCRERVCQYVSISVVSVSLKKKTKKNIIVESKKKK